MLVILIRRSTGQRPFSTTNVSRLYTKNSFTRPPSVDEKPDTQTEDTNKKKKKKPLYRPPSSLDRSRIRTIKTRLPFDFQFSYTESSSKVRPIGLSEPKYSPFGPDRLDRVWTGVSALAVNSSKVKYTAKVEARRKQFWDIIQGQELTNVEKNDLVHRYGKANTRSRITLGRNGLTHNMLNSIHLAWKNAEAVRIRCFGVPTVDMNNVCTQLEDKTFGKIIHRQGGSLMLYRGRNYDPKKRPVIPLMLWKPHDPVYPELIKTPIEGLSIKETEEMRKNGFAVHALTKLAKNGYYGHLVPMIRGAFRVVELLRIDCRGLAKEDYRKLGTKLRDLVPCILVTFAKEQMVIWRGKDYKPKEDGCFFTERESFNKSVTNPGDGIQDVNHGQNEFVSDDEK